VLKDGKASTSYLQRKLAIGYNSAAKLIERMENEGVITHADHVGRRQVLMGRGGVDGTDPTDHF
jgi:S-DNA-T family DNA segregation ATPase FtsK/SpoIIIE